MKKTIITVVGKDTVGIIAKVCAYLAENEINILDITQTIVDGFFNMMMITDASGSGKGNGERLPRNWKSWEKRSVLLSDASTRTFLIKCTESKGTGKKR